MRDKIKRLETQAGMRMRETALPISILPGQKTFIVRWGYWGGDRPTPTHTDEYPMSRLDEICDWLETERLAAWPTAVRLEIVDVGEL